MGNGGRIRRPPYPLRPARCRCQVRIGGLAGLSGKRGPVGMRAAEIRGVFPLFCGKTPSHFRSPSPVPSQCGFARECCYREITALHRREQLYTGGNSFTQAGTRCHQVCANCACSGVPRRRFRSAARVCGASVPKKLPGRFISCRGAFRYQKRLLRIRQASAATAGTCPLPAAPTRSTTWATPSGVRPARPSATSRAGSASDRLEIASALHR